MKTFDKERDYYGFSFLKTEKITPKYFFWFRRSSKRRNEKRLLKWRQMLETGNNIEKIDSRIVKGPPDGIRSFLWSFYLKETIIPKIVNKSSFDFQIELDIRRTFTEHIFINSSSGKEILSSLLKSYAVFDTEVGYCQGMSWIAAVFIVYFDKKKAFILFCSLMQEIRLFFCPGFSALFQIFKIHSRLLGKILPDINKLLVRLNILPSLYISRWYLSLFTFLPFPITLRIWDLLFYYGKYFLSAVSVSLLKHSISPFKKYSEETLSTLLCKIEVEYFSVDKNGRTSHGTCNEKLANSLIKKSFFYWKIMLKKTNGCSLLEKILSEI